MSTKILFPTTKLASPKQFVSNLSGQVCRIMTAAGGSPMNVMNRVAKNALQPFATNDAHHYLRSLLADRKGMSDLAGRSQRHELGFLKIVVHEEHDFRLRLHVYLPGAFAAEVPHNHRAWLASAVVTGQLTTRTFDEAAKEDESALEFAEFCFSKRAHAPRADVTYVGRTLLVPSQPKTVKLGAYTLHPDVVHQVQRSSLSTPTLTLVCTAQPVRPWNRVLLHKGHFLPDQTIHRLKPKELARAFEQVLGV